MKNRIGILVERERERERQTIGNEEKLVLVLPIESAEKFRKEINLFCYYYYCTGHSLDIQGSTPTTAI
jgi:hypothetical protein